MRVHGEHQILDRALKLHHCDAFRDQLGRERSDDVYAQDLAEFRVADDFHEAVMLTNDRGARISRKGELANLDLAPELFGFRFGQPDAADLRVAIRCTGYSV